jgi:cleavage stimulation factor subunit 3
MADFFAENAFLESITGKSNVANEYNVDRNADMPAAGEPNGEVTMGESLPTAPGHDDDDDYDPSGLITDAKPAPKSTSSDPQNGGTSKPQRKGGFMIESDDEADGDGNTAATANGVDGAGGSSDAQRSSTGTPVAAFTSAEAHVSVPSDQNLSSHAIPSTNPPISNPTSNRAVNPVPSGGGAEAAASDSRARNPDDVVGILEDRIQEDPRGDVEAWLALLHEHQSHDRFDHVRNVYTRFFQYFPTAVSQLPDSKLANNDRCRNSSRIWTWSSP